MKHIKLFLFILIFANSSYAITFPANLNSFAQINRLEGRYEITDLNGVTSTFVTGDTGLVVRGETRYNSDAIIAEPAFDSGNGLIQITARGTEIPNSEGNRNFDSIPTINLDSIGIGLGSCLLYTSPSPRDATLSRMPSSA